MIAITGATGNLGRLVVKDLIDRGFPPRGIVAAVRSPEKASDLAGRGVDIREADYTEPDTLATAFEGIDRLLLVSSPAVGERLAHHRNVVDAAEKNGVGFLAYTSILRADASPLTLAAEHRETEEYIQDSGLRFTFLRNGWYIENYTEQLDRALEQGALIGSAGDSRISAATRADYAAAAATVLTGDSDEGAVYELGGDQAFTIDELAAEITEQSGFEVVYRDLPPEKYRQVLFDAGLPEAHAEAFADADQGIAEGHLYTESEDLRRLIGRPTTAMAEAVADALKARA